MRSNIETVQSIYEAFGKGDIPYILKQLRPDVRWDHRLASNEIPWLRPYTGVDNVGAFFRGLSDVEFHRFDVGEVMAGRTQVAAVVTVDATYKPTGRRMKDEEVHLWTFDPDGRVAEFAHKVDTLDHARVAGVL